MTFYLCTKSEHTLTHMPIHPPPFPPPPQPPPHCHSRLATERSMIACWSKP
ncbi:hypothetical protein HanRHA438_Chr04g0160451 [Helianthus annuus]|nr:hypothetical protein HanIR_Chr04g0161741 [Helianthus annuus]KAJ0925502.1 hypothetical protein HanRHA438_Chr04g0160451 [Helianthus annuus]